MVHRAARACCEALPSIVSQVDRSSSIQEDAEARWGRSKTRAGIMRVHPRYLSMSCRLQPWASTLVSMEAYRHNPNHSPPLGTQLLYKARFRCQRMYSRRTQKKEGMRWLGLSDGGDNFSVGWGKGCTGEKAGEGKSWRGKVGDRTDCRTDFLPADGVTSFHTHGTRFVYVAQLPVATAIYLPI